MPRTRFDLLLFADEHKRISDAAATAGVSMNAWIRTICLVAADAVTGVQPDLKPGAKPPAQRPAYCMLAWNDRPKSGRGRPPCRGACEDPQHCTRDASRPEDDPDYIEWR